MAKSIRRGAFKSGSDNSWHCIFIACDAMPVSQSDIDNLNAAIASGERQVTIGSQSITYRSIDDLIKARNDLRQQMADEQATASSQPQKRRSYAYYAGRGYDK